MRRLAAAGVARILLVRGGDGASSPARSGPAVRRALTVRIRRARSDGPTKVYLHDRDVSDDGTFDESGDIGTRLVSAMVDGTVPAGNATKPDITPDGSQLAFVSEQVLDPAIVAAAAEEETDTATQIWKVAVAAGDVTEVVLSSHAPDGAAGDLGSGLANGPTLSDDGSVVAFESDATNLVVGDLNGDTDAFVDDDGTVACVSVSGRPESLGDEVDLATQTLNPCNGNRGSTRRRRPTCPSHRGWERAGVG